MNDPTTKNEEDTRVAALTALRDDMEASLDRHRSHINGEVQGQGPQPVQSWVSRLDQQIDTLSTTPQTNEGPKKVRTIDGLTDGVESSPVVEKWHRDAIDYDRPVTPTPQTDEKDHEHQDIVVWCEELRALGVGATVAQAAEDLVETCRDLRASFDSTPDDGLSKGGQILKARLREVSDIALPPPPGPAPETETER